MLRPCFKKLLLLTYKDVDCKFRDYFRIIQIIRALNFPKRRNHVSLQEKQRNAM